MGLRHMSWAIAQECKNAGQKLVLLMLCNHANDHTNLCFPSHSLLAKECCMGKSTVKQHISDLAKAGFLRVIPRVKEGVSLSNYYRMNFEGVGQKAEMDKARDAEMDGMGVNDDEDPSQNQADPSQELPHGGPESGRGVGQDSATEPEFSNSEVNAEVKKREAPKENQPDQPNGPLSATPSPKTRQKKTKSSICPQSFTLDPELRQWCAATAPGVNVDRELQKFMAHEFKTPKSNWNLAFKNWMLRAVEYQGQTASPIPRAPSRSPMSSADAQRMIDTGDLNGFELA